MTEPIHPRIAIIGLGYVGLPLALAFADAYPGTIGFDINPRKLDDLRNGLDRTGEISSEALKASSLRYTGDPTELSDSTFFVVVVPTPIDRSRSPVLKHLVSASEIVGKVLKKGDLVVFESTVYPGVTEEVCGPVLDRVSGLRHGVDYKLGYSPERINPGDREHTLANVVKIVSGEDDESLDRIARIYGAIVPAGVHRAPSIKVAEAAKVIENTQRDLNIALMNELAIILDRLNLRTADVLEAAGTKWNFLPFKPGLVGGHCIGVDPYYFTTRAQQAGYQPQVILAGRQVNEGMGAFIAQRMVKLMVQAGRAVKKTRVGILGLTFKENVTDLRSTRVVDVVAELKRYGVTVAVHDPMANPEDTVDATGLALASWEDLSALDGLIFAVPHRQYLEMGINRLCSTLGPGGVFLDVKSVYRAADLPPGVPYWSL